METNENIEYPPCKKCGSSHQMGIEDMETGKITPIDLCYRCLWTPLKVNPEPYLFECKKEDDPNLYQLGYAPNMDHI